MAEIIPFRRLKRAPPRLLPSLAAAAARRRRRGRLLTLVLMLVAFLGSAAAVGLALPYLDGDLGATLRELAGSAVELPPAGVAPGEVVARFPLCGGGFRQTCVVDGDTFWLSGTKYRIADIDTPEVTGFACPAEQRLAAAATRRLGALLGAGPFTLAPVERDEDVYGRKLRLVLRNGRSLGEVLVAEGLAHRWEGGKRGWC